MFGSNYADSPEFLLRSLREMNVKYKHTYLPSSSPVASFFQRLYVKIFGIPEIGFQLRGLYFRKAIRRIKNLEYTTILDVGSGIGCYVFYLADKYPSAHVDGYEVDTYKLKMTQQLARTFNVHNVHFISKNIATTPSGSQTYSFVITIDVLEHVKNYKKMLIHIYDTLKFGGYFYVHVPQIHQKRFFRESQNWKHKDHVREGFDIHILRRTLKDIGFTNIRITHTFGYFGSFAWELQHIFLSKNQIIAALTYPLLYLMARVDTFVTNRHGLGMAILAQKKRP